MSEAKVVLEVILTGGCIAGEMMRVYGAVPFFGVNLRSEPRYQLLLVRLVIKGDIQEAGHARSATTPFSPKTSTARDLSGEGTQEPCTSPRQVDSALP